MPTWKDSTLFGTSQRAPGTKPSRKTTVIRFATRSKPSQQPVFCAVAGCPRNRWKSGVCWLESSSQVTTLRAAISLVARPIGIICGHLRRKSDRSRIISYAGCLTRFNPSRYHLRLSACPRVASHAELDLSPLPLLLLPASPPTSPRQTTRLRRVDCQLYSTRLRSLCAQALSPESSQSDGSKKKTGR